MLLAAGELFSEEVATLQADAVAGGVLSVVRTPRARYEALGDANARSCLPRVVVLVEGNLLKVRRRQLELERRQRGIASRLNGTAAVARYRAHR